MGPTNLALLKLFHADRALREANSRLEAVTKDVRVQEARNAALGTRLENARKRLQDLTAKNANFELELKAREEHIEKLRGRQQMAANNKEYQALLVEINTAKVDRAKIEETAIKNLEQLELATNDVKNLTAGYESEQAKLAEMSAKVGDKAIEAKAEVDRLRPERDAATVGIKPIALDAFNKLADRYDGDAMAPIDKPNPRDEEYLCTGCQMGLVADIYNKLKVRDDVVTCPTCRRILYIPDTLSADNVVTKKGGGRGKSSTTVKRTVKKKSTAVVISDGTVIESAPESKWAPLVSAAQGESARDAKEADHKPVECKVEINGETVGVYKGKSLEHLERVIRFRLEEAKMTADVKLTLVQVVSTPDAPAAEPESVPEESNA